MPVFVLFFSLLVKPLLFVFGQPGALLNLRKPPSTVLPPLVRQCHMTKLQSSFFVNVLCPSLSSSCSDLFLHMAYNQLYLLTLFVAVFSHLICFLFVSVVVSGHCIGGFIN